MTLRYQPTAEDIAFCENVVCAGYHAIKLHTLQVVEDCLDEDIAGDFAECGVLYGAHPAVMLRSLIRRGIRNRKVHLFDSFEGIPRATADDPPEQQAAYGLSNGQMESSGVSVSTIDNTVKNLRAWGVYDPALIEIHAGWFHDSLDSPTVRALGPLAILRVDVDLYESTKCVYQHLYNKVTPGGYVIDDDWGPPGAVTACRRAVFDAIGKEVVSDGKTMHVIDAHVHHVDGQDTTAWWRKR